MSDPKQPPETRSARIIVPGAEPEPAERPRIILPPGTSVESHDDVPEYPRLRPVQITPVRDNGREVLVVQDPLGITPGAQLLGLETLALLQLMDGTTSLTEIQALIMRESKDLRVGNMVRDFVARLDELLLLHSPRFEAAWAEAQREYHRLEVRPAAMEGICYPDEPRMLEAFLDEHFAAAEKLRAEAGEPAAAPGALPRALLAPHLDPRREGATMARAYLELGEGEGPPLRVIVYGTGHGLSEDLLALTRKRVETPLGQAVCDTAFVDRLAERLGPAAYHGEMAHRDEHSIEFQVLYLQRRLRGRRFTLVPILCGGFHRLLDDRKGPRDEPALESFVTAARETLAELGGDTLHVAGVDLSHVGPRFGDPRLDEDGLTWIRQADEAALEAAASGDAEAWFQAIAATEDATRICGFAPTYCMLRVSEPGSGRRLARAESTEPDTTVVTVAAMAWP